MGIKSEKIIEADSVFTVINAVREPGFYFEGESHDFWELVYIAGGRAGITADDRIYTLSEGDLILHKPMEFHKIWAVDDTELHVFILSFSLSGSGIEGLKNRTFRLSHQKRTEIERLIKTAEAAFLRVDGCFVTAVKDVGKAQLYFNMLENFLIEISDNDSVHCGDDKDSRMFAEIVGFLNENTDKNLSVEYVAEQCYVSTAKLKKLFSAYTGMGVIAYFTKLKIKKAMELLSGGASVRETAEMLSYSSQFYLSYVFKKETGLTPSEYKKGAANT